MAQNQPVQRLLAVSGTMQYALLVGQTRNDDDDGGSEVWTKG